MSTISIQIQKRVLHYWIRFCIPGNRADWRICSPISSSSHTRLFSKLSNAKGGLGCWREADQQASVVLTMANIIEQDNLSDVNRISKSSRDIYGIRTLRIIYEYGGEQPKVMMSKCC